MESTNPVEPNPEPSTYVLRESGPDPAGTWTDPATSLMWTTRDNGSNASWDQAANYCATLKLGGYSNWQLPRIEELQSIYEHKNTTAMIDRRSANALARSEYHIKGGIIRTGLPWDFTTADSRELLFNFGDGKQYSMRTANSPHLTALCVRYPTSKASTLSTEFANPAEPNPKPAPGGKTQGSDQLYIDSHVSLQNECAKANISVALRYESPQGWITRGWFVAKPSEAKSLVLPSLRRSSIIYVYAQGGGMSWDGRKDGQTYNADVVDQVFVYHDGESVQGSNKRTVSMFSRQGTDNTSLRFGCPAGVPGESRSSSAGTWTDPATGLMWTTRNSAMELNWLQAANYCTTLNLGGYSNWRLPSIGQLEGVYDERALVATNQYHIKGGIILQDNSAGAEWEWSETTGRDGDALTFAFVAGRSQVAQLTWGRALCVRRSGE